MTVFETTNHEEITAHILNSVEEEFFPLINSGNLKVDLANIKKISELIAFLNESNELGAALDDFEPTDKTVSVIARGPFIGFGYKEPIKLAELISDAVGFSGSVFKLKPDDDEPLMVRIQISMPGVFKWGDSDEQ